MTSPSKGCSRNELRGKASSTPLARRSRRRRTIPSLLCPPAGCSSDILPVRHPPPPAPHPRLPPAGQVTTLHAGGLWSRTSGNHASCLPNSQSPEPTGGLLLLGYQSHEPVHNPSGIKILFSSYLLYLIKSPASFLLSFTTFVSNSPFLCV